MAPVLLVLASLSWAAPGDPPPDPGAPVVTVDGASDSSSGEAERPPGAVLQDILDRVPRFSGVEAAWSGPVLTLTGQVPTAEARDALLRLAESQGADFVDDQTRVVLAEDATANQRGDDDEIAAQLVEIYREIPGLQDVQVAVNRGVVRLSGSVVDSDLVDEAVSVAEDRARVSHVVDDLTLSTDVRQQLSPAVVKAREQLTNVIARIPIFLVALLVFALAWILGRAISRWDSLFGRLSERPLLLSMVRNLVRAGIVGAGALIALEILDATALVSAILGTAGVLGLAVGFAFQDIVENYLAGVLLSIQQPFSKDDFIDVDGTSGVVIKLTTRNTLLLTLEGNHAYLPNAKVFKASVVNFSRNPHRRFHFTVGVGVEEDLAEVIRVGVRTLRALDGVADDPPPTVHIGELGDSSVVVNVYGWLDQRKHGFLAVRTEAIRAVKVAFDEAGFDMPEPIYRVAMLPPLTPKPKSAPKPSDGPAVNTAPETDIERQAQREREREPGTDLLEERKVGAAG